MEDLVIHISDIRRANHCVRGARTWFRARGLDFGKFIAEGMPAEELLRRSNNDPLIVDIIERTRERMRDNG